MVVAIAITHVPIYTPAYPGGDAAIREMEYAEAARTVGNRGGRISCLLHLLPNCVPPAHRPGDPGHGLRHPDGGRPVLHRAGHRAPAERVGSR